MTHPVVLQCSCDFCMVFPTTDTAKLVTAAVNLPFAHAIKDASDCTTHFLFGYRSIVQRAKTILFKARYKLTGSQLHLA